MAGGVNSEAWKTSIVALNAMGLGPLCRVPFAKNFVMFYPNIVITFLHYFSSEVAAINFKP
jgi:hypothetical protein